MVHLVRTFMDVNEHERLRFLRTSHIHFHTSLLLYYIFGK